MTRGTRLVEYRRSAHHAHREMNEARQFGGFTINDELASTAHSRVSVALDEGGVRVAVKS